MSDCTANAGDDTEASGQADVIDIKSASVEELLPLLEDQDSLQYLFDRWSTEEVLSRLDVLESESAPIGTAAEDLERIRSACRFHLRNRHGVDRPELKAFTSYTDVATRAELEMYEKDSVEGRIASSPKEILSYSGREMIGAKLREREWLLEPLVKQESSVMLYADAGVGKM